MSQSLAQFWDSTKKLADKGLDKAFSVAGKAVEKGKEVSAKTKEVVKVKLGRTETAEQLVLQLERKAEEAVTLGALCELHRSWVKELNRRDGGVNYALLEGSENSQEVVLVLDDNEKENNGSLNVNIDLNSIAPIESSTSNKQPPRRMLTFKQVFLKSRALELSLKNIFSDEYLRKRFTQPTPDDQSSHSFFLYALLQLSLSCPPEIFGGLLRVGTEAQILSEKHIDWLSLEVFGALKLDWLDEVFHSERKKMAIRAESLRNEIRAVKTAFPSLSDEELEKQHRTKVLASKELVDLYNGLKSNMEKALEHRAQSLRSRDNKVQGLLREMEKYAGELAGGQVTSEEMREKLAESMEEAAGKLKVQLEGIDREREELDNEIEELEVRKRNLKLEIESVTGLLLNAKARQKEFMVKQDEKRNVMYSEKSSFKKQISEKEQLLLELQVGEVVLEKIRELVAISFGDNSNDPSNNNSSSGSVKLGMERQISELSKKRDQFDTHFLEVLRDHLRYEDDRVTSIAQIAKASCGRLIKLSDSGDEGVLFTSTTSTSFEGGVLTRGEYLVRERHIFTKASHDLELAWTDVENFKRAHERELEGSSALRDAVARTEGKYKAVKKEIGPGLDLMVQGGLEEGSKGVSAQTFSPTSRVEEKTAVFSPKKPPSSPKKGPAPPTSPKKEKVVAPVAPAAPPSPKKEEVVAEVAPPSPKKEEAVAPVAPAAPPSPKKEEVAGSVAPAAPPSPEKENPACFEENVSEEASEEPFTEETLSKAQKKKNKKNKSKESTGEE